MRAALIRGYGGPEQLRVEQVPPPELQAGHLLLRVRAAGVNPLDYKVRRGDLKLLTWRRFPLVPGADVSGEVISAGSRRFRSGDAVYAMLNGIRGGAYAEYASVPEEAAALRPRNVGWEAAAAVPVAGVTALVALRDRAGVQAGQEVLVNGASGGVGTFAIQVARVLGARVTAVCAPDAFPLVRELGADRVLDYRRDDFTRGAERYDVVFDVAGTRGYGECKGVLRPGGIYLTTLPGPRNLWDQLRTLVLSRTRARVVGVRPDGDRLETLRAWIEAGEIRPVVDRVFPLAEAAEAHRYLEHGHPRGKVVLAVT